MIFVTLGRYCKLYAEVNFIKKKVKLVSLEKTDLQNSVGVILRRVFLHETSLRPPKHRIAHMRVPMRMITPQRILCETRVKQNQQPSWRAYFKAMQITTRKIAL